MFAELRVMAGKKKIGTGLQVLGRINLLDPFLEIIGRGKINGPFLEGLLVEPLPLATVINVLSGWRWDCFIRLTQSKGIIRK